MPTPQLPGYAASPLTPTGHLSKEWYRYLKWLGERDTSTEADADDTEYKLVGPVSIVVSGLLQNGLASLALKNDELSPATTSYYGTDDAGEKGWYLIADALDVTADLEKSVDGTTNVVTFGLADLADAGTGELLGITRDAKGRVSGTKPVTAGSNITITDVGASIEIAASGGGSGSLFDKARFYDECFGSALLNGWTTDHNGGTITPQANPSSDIAGAYGMASGATSGQRAGLYAPGFKVPTGTGEVHAQFRVRPTLVPSGSQQTDYTFGLGDAAGTTGHAESIQIFANDTNGAWQLQYTIAGVPTLSTVTAPIAANTTYDFELLVAADGSSVDFILNGTVLETVAISGALGQLNPFIRCRKSGANGGSATLYLDTCLVEWER